MIPVIGAHDKLLPEKSPQHALPRVNSPRRDAPTWLIFGQIDQFIDSRHGFDTA